MKTVWERERSTRRQRGQAVIFLAIGLTLVAGMAGLALDVGHDYTNRRAIQAGADSAANAGAQMLVRNVDANFPFGTSYNPAAGPYTSCDVLKVAAGSGVQSGLGQLAQAGDGHASAQPQVYWLDKTGSRIGTAVSCTSPAAAIPATAVGVEVDAVDTHPTYVLRAIGMSTASESVVSKSLLRYTSQLDQLSVYAEPYAGFYYNCTANRPIAVGDDIVFRDNGYGSTAACPPTYQISSNNFKGYFHDGSTTIALGPYSTKGGNACGQEPLAALGTAYRNHQPIVIPIIKDASGNGANLTLTIVGYESILLDADYSSGGCGSTPFKGTVVSLSPTLPGLTSCVATNTGCTTGLSLGIRFEQ